MSTPPHTILHLFVTLPMGGAENLLKSLVGKLDPVRYRSVICCIHKRDVIGEELAAAGYPVVELGLMARKGYDRRVVPALLELVRREGVALIHSHLYHANLYGRLAARKARIPAVASVHNTYADVRKWHRHLLNRLLARYSRAIIAGSEEIRGDILRHDRVDPALLRVIPNAVDLSLSHSNLTREQARERLGIGGERLVLGSVGRLERQKGHRYLMAALPLLRRQGVDPLWLLVGAGREGEALRTQAEALGVSEQVRFLGTRRDLGDLFRAMDLFVMPSLWEGLSLAMLSAMAAELPVLATAVGGVPEVLAEGRCGRVVPPQEPAALADGVVALLADPTGTRAMALAGAARAREHYGDDAMACRVATVYQEILG